MSRGTIKFRLKKAEEENKKRDEKNLPAPVEKDNPKEGDSSENADPKGIEDSKDDDESKKSKESEGTPEGGDSGKKEPTEKELQELIDERIKIILKGWLTKVDGRVDEKIRSLDFVKSEELDNLIEKKIEKGFSAFQESYEDDLSEYDKRQTFFAKTGLKCDCVVYRFTSFNEEKGKWIKRRTEREVRAINPKGGEPETRLFTLFASKEGDIPLDFEQSELASELNLISEVR